MDEPRLLHRRSELGYTRSAAVALQGEPEAVSEDEQWLLTRQAQKRELAAWERSRDRLLAEIAHLRQHVHSQHVPRAARALEREVRALDRKLCDR